MRVSWSCCRQGIVSTPGRGIISAECQTREGFKDSDDLRDDIDIEAAGKMITEDYGGDITGFAYGRGEEQYQPVKP